MLLEESLATVLKKYRSQCNLSQEELAFRCELDRTYISLIERKKRRPTLNVIFNICRNLNIKPSLLVKEIEDLMLQDV
ncbi:helix-turn-helix domain-containing protein [Ruminiclostridium cellobioparum]|jgi:transcriptional regulator with XRE-family HTH domain|uniref:Helix-turn-helix protein n=1 Tax=Ruminiclostridium cellobioparum subsp. termitidis CT1112 TaxID=1195236 RepID=S0FHP5_RUMCE|nr:helix-turn-helix transcriptional regulator [Ruminiclostridium cellobioparum]EMS69461.1 helix-turn-helix protein [Ruminiclostridium cellobioparum subsp. termitidis CT1112]